MTMEPAGRYESSRLGWAGFSNSETLAESCESVAVRGALYAIGISPQESGEYRTSWRVERDLYISPRYGPRAAARLWNDAPHAAAVEFSNRSVHTAQGVVARTAEFLGGG